jgi:tape measure domain-containing protein
MAEIDDRVVAMSFEGDKFQSGAEHALGTLGRLKEALGFGGASKGLSELENQVGRFSMGGMASKISDSVHHFSLLKLAGISAIASITNRAVNAGITFAKAFTIDPIKAGFASYEEQINAVQTITANTGLKGAKGMQQINDVLHQLQIYANKTVYSFSDMARNIGTFTAAGVNLKTSEQSIEGIANLAAASGSSAQQASSAMYQLSQAIAAGQVHLQDWNSVVNAGIGGKLFQNALVQTGIAMGTINKNAVKSVGPMHSLTINGNAFRNSLTPKKGQPSWLTSEVLTTTLSNFTGQISKAKLASEGFTAEQIKAIEAQAKVATEAATKIKTFSQLTQALKEEVATAYGAIFKTIFGNIGQAKTLFSSLHTFFENALTNPLYHFNTLLQQAVKLGARSDFIQGFKNLGKDIGSVITPLKEAFRDIFPKTTANAIVTFAEKFKEITASLRVGTKTGTELRDTFKGIFAVFDIGRQIVVGLFHVLGDLFSAGRKNSGGFLAITAAIGNWLQKLDEAIRKGGAFTHFFQDLGHYVSEAAHFLGLIPAAIAGLFNGFQSKEADKISGTFGSIGSGADTIRTKLDEAGQNVRRFFSAIGSDIGSALKGVNWNASLTAVNVGLFGGIFLLFRKLVSKITSGFKLDLSGGLIGKVKESFEALTGTFEGMQKNLKADALEKIAIAIGVLAGSLALLSTIDGEKLKVSLGALAVAFAELLTALKVLSGISGGAAGLKLPVVASGLILLSTAIAGLVGSVYLLSRLSWDQLKKGLAGVAALLTAISVASIPLSANSAGMIRAGLGVTAIAGAMIILARAVKDFGQMDLKVLAKGIGAVAVSITAIGLAANVFPKGMVLIGAGLLAIATAMLLLTKSVAKFGGMDLKTLGKGILSMAAALTAIGLAVRTMPKSLALQAVGLDLIALALGHIVKAVAGFGSLSMTSLAKGLGGLAASLGILVLALRGVEGATKGALALAVIGFAINTLAKGVIALGHQSIGDLAKGLGALAIAFTAVALAANALEPATAGLVGFGAAVALAGAGFAGIGLGVDLLVTGIGKLVALGGKGIHEFGDAIAALAKAIPPLFVGLANGFVAAAKAIAAHGPELVVALTKILGDLLKAVIISAPKFAVAFGAVILAIIKVLRDNAGPIIKEGVRLLEELLSGIASAIGKVTIQVSNIVIHFLDALSSKLPQIIAAGAKTLEKFLDGLASKLPGVIASAARVIVQFFNGLISNIPKVVAAGAKAVVTFLDAIASKLPGVITAGAKVIASFIAGIAANIPRLLKQGANIIGSLLLGLSTAAIKLIDQGAQAVINFFNGIASGITKYEPLMVTAFINMGKAAAKGFGNALGQAASSPLGFIGNFVSGVVGGVKKGLGIHSPSTIFHEIGMWTMKGFTQGLDQHSKETLATMSKIANKLIDDTKKIFQIRSPSQVMYSIGKYVGEGFAKGLAGTKDQIQGVFQTLHDTLTTQIQSASSAIQSAETSLKTATKATRAGYEATIASESALLTRLVALRSTLTGGMNSQRTELEGLANSYANLANKLKNAQTALQNAQQTEASAVQGYEQSFETLPTLDSTITDPGLQTQKYISDLETQVTQLQQYAAVLKQLRTLGLDNATYMKLLSEGPVDLPFAQQLLEAGQTGVQSINKLDSALTTAGNGLAQTAGDQLYGAGVAAAQAVVDGIQKQMKQVAQNMKNLAHTIMHALEFEIKHGAASASATSQSSGHNISANLVFGINKGIADNTGSANKAIAGLADSMITTFKKKLQIKSPSAIFAQMGGQTVDGFAVGLTNSQNKMTTVVGGLGDSAITAMQKSLDKASSVALNHIDSNPVITPVLDLTQVKAGAKQLGDITSPFSVATASTTAAAVNKQQAKSIADLVGSQNSKVLTFEQNNYSPKALSEIEIYRQTQNQLSQAKKMLEAT